MSASIPENQRLPTGVPGLDDVLGGGLTPERMYMLEGCPGSGKTTLALQFLLEGAARGEQGLYVTMAETPEELRAVAATHGWSLDGITIFELRMQDGLDFESEQTILHPAELELGEATRTFMAQVDQVHATRVVFDSLSEMRLLAQSALRHRRQVVALKHFFSQRRCTVLLLNDHTSAGGDLQLHSIAYGVIRLDQSAQQIGSQRRRLEIIKMRGTAFRGGLYDMDMDRGGLRVFDWLTPPGMRPGAPPDARSGARPGATNTALAKVSTGSEHLDRMLGGGLVPGTNTLLLGPSGAGKTTTAVHCMLAALERGETASYLMFDEAIPTLLARVQALGMDLAPHVASGRLRLVPVSTAGLSPGAFADLLRQSVERHHARFLVIDSFNAYLRAMPGERFLVLQMQQALSYLVAQGVLTLLIMDQPGTIGASFDTEISYLSDTILLFRLFEALGEIRKSICVLKCRFSSHEPFIREFSLSERGLEIGQALTDFEGVLGGLPSYRGRLPLLDAAPAAAPKAVPRMVAGDGR